MTIFEIVLQGIRNFEQITRIRLKGNLNIIQGDNGSGKSTLLDSLLATLYGSTWSASQDLGPKKPGSTCQAGIILKSNKGGIFRITRDFTHHRQALSQLNGEKKFLTRTKDDAKILQFIFQELQGLSGEEIEKSSFIRRSDLPSARSNRIAAPKKDLPHPENSRLNAVPSTDTHEVSPALREREERLTELENMKKKAETFLQIEEDLADQQDQAKDLRKRIQLESEKSNELKNIIIQETAFSIDFIFPPNFEDLIKTFEQGEKDQQPFLQEMEEEKTEILNNLIQLPETTLFQNRYLWLGTGIITINFIIGSFMNLQGGLRHIFLVGFAFGIGFILWSIWKDHSVALKRTDLHDQIDLLYKKQETQEETFKKNHASILDLLNKSACKNTAELREKNKIARNLLQKQNEFEKQIRDLLQGKTIEELKQALHNIQIKIEKLESEKLSFEGTPSDLFSIQEEIRILEEKSSADTNSDEKSQILKIFETSQPTETLSVPSALQEDSLSNPLSANLDPMLYQKLFPIKPESMRVASNALFKSMAPQQGWEITLSPEGNVSVKDSDGSSLPWKNINSGSLDLIWIVLFLSGQGLLKNKHPFPLLLDDPFIGLDIKRQIALLKVLRAISRYRQVIFSTTRDLPIQEGDHKIKL